MCARKALIAGSTGLIGGYCLQALLDDPAYSEVIALQRRPVITRHGKLKELLTTFDATLEKTLSTVNAQDIFCCLGSTIKKAGSQEAFRKIDFSLVLAVASSMRKQGADQFIVVSAMGADQKSKIFYNRIKGEMEESLKGLNYPCLRIIRPSLLLGNRKEFRFAERAVIMLNPLWKMLLIGPLKKYKPVEAEKVARFMVKVAHQQPISGVHVYESNLIS